MLESWIADRPFREAHPPRQSDLDIARGTHAREILQDHWRNWIIDSDWAWLAETGINTVRIPVSLMAFSEPSPRIRLVVSPTFFREVSSHLSPASCRLGLDARYGQIFHFCSRCEPPRVPLVLLRVLETLQSYWTKETQQ